MRTSCYDICNEVFVTFKGRLDELESSSWNKWRARVWERQWQRVRGGRDREIASVLCVHCMCAHLKCIQSRLDRLDMIQIYVFARQHYKMPQSIFAPHTNTHTQSEQRVCLLSHLIMHSLSLRYTHTHTPTQWQLNWKSVAYIAGLTENFLQIKCQARLLEKSNYKTEISQKNRKCCVRSRAKHFKHFI